MRYQTLKSATQNGFTAPVLQHQWPVSDFRLSGISDLSVRDAARGFLMSPKASNRYSYRYLESLEFSIALLAAYAEGQVWPAFAHLTTRHLEEYLTYLQNRPRWFGRRNQQRKSGKARGRLLAIENKKASATGGIVRIHCGGPERAETRTIELTLETTEISGLVKRWGLDA